MKWNMSIAASALLLLTGCTYSNTTTEKKESIESDQRSLTAMQQTEFGEDETETQQASTPEEVIIETENRLNTGVPVKLPISLPISTGYHLSAKIYTAQNQYSVTFIETKHPLPIDSEELENSEGDLATLKATRYATPELAAKQIEHQNYAINGAKEVDLGFYQKGYRDAGAGSQFLGWNEGRWSLDMRALTEQGEGIVTEAKNVVEYLEKNTLPIPREWGAAKFDVSDTNENHSNHIAWQEDAIVYEIETSKSMMYSLQIAVSIQDRVQ